MITSAACGGSSPTAPDAAPSADAAATPDASPDATPDAAMPDAAMSDAAPQVPAITVETQLAPALISYRDRAGGDWQVPTATSPHTFTFAVAGPYTVTVVCDDGDGIITVDQVARTPDDRRTIDSWCFAASASANDVKGHMAQAGSVVVGSTLPESSTTPDWDFTARSPDGVYDLVATTIDRIAIRRGVVVHGATTISPAVDLTREGFDLAATPFTAANATEAETVNARVTLYTEHAQLVNIYRGSPEKLTVAPNQALTATDHQEISISAELGHSSRNVQRDQFRAADAREVVFPDALGPLRFTTANRTLGVTWSTLPEHDGLELRADAFSAADGFTSWFYNSVATKAFEAATGATNLEVDTTIPGFKPEWRIDFAAEYFRHFGATRERTGEVAGSAWNETVNPRSASREAALRRHASDRASIERRARR